jgi:hypothetical protein
LPSSPLTEPDVQISSFRFLTGELRSQRCNDDTIRDSSVKKRSCQFSYPLPFRGQVCETQSSLPCCPSAVLSSRRPPFLDRIPARPVLRRHQYYEGATTSFASGAHAIPPRFVLAVASAPGRWEEVPPQAKIIVQPVISSYRRTFTWTRVGPLRFPDDPSCASAPFQDPGRTDEPLP